VGLGFARLDAAKRFGSDAVVDARATPEQLITDPTDGLGADVVIEAVGVPETFEPCTHGAARRARRQRRRADGAASGCASIP
jgi:threonine dehydrogenase-like Zn-dependent dehydrogenase